MQRHFEIIILVIKTKPLAHSDKILKQQFETLFREHFTGLCYFAHKYLGDMDSCKEIVHNVFVSVWEKRHEFDFEKPAKSYLFTSVYNRSMNHIRDKKKFISSDEEVSIHILEKAGDFNNILETAELEARINLSIMNLPEKCKQIFQMNRYDEKKYSEIAEELGISVKTVEAQMSKALKILRENLKDYIYWFLLFLWINKF